MDKKNVQEIFNLFNILGEVSIIKPYGKGNINFTFFVQINGQKYILQKINQIFNIGGVMNNISTIQKHLQKKQDLGLWDKSYKILNSYYALNGNNYVFIDGDYWRIYDFIDDSITQDAIYYYHQAEEVGELIGQFHLCLSDLKTELYNPLPGFHHTPTYFNNFKEINSKTLINKESNIEKWIYERKVDIDYFFELIQSGKINTRITHNDPKVNNILFNKYSGKPTVIIDWDTISNSLPVLIDIGDMCRSICINTLEEGDDFEVVSFQEDLFESLIKGYLKNGKNFLSIEEKNNIVFSIGFIIFELSLRFYSDYLDGNKYFRVRYPFQNLEKAKKMFYLWKSFDSKKDVLEKIVRKYI